MNDFVNPSQISVYPNLHTGFKKANSENHLKQLSSVKLHISGSYGNEITNLIGEPTE